MPMHVYTDADDARRSLLDYGAARKRQIEAHNELMLRSRDPWEHTIASINIPGYQIKAGGPRYEWGEGEPLDPKEGRFIWAVLAIAALCFAGGLAFLIFWLRGGCPWQ